MRETEEEKRKLNQLAMGLTRAMNQDVQAAIEERAAVRQVGRVAFLVLLVLPTLIIAGLLLWSDYQAEEADAEFSRAVLEAYLHQQSQVLRAEAVMAVLEDENLRIEQCASGVASRCFNPWEAQATLEETRKTTQERYPHMDAPHIEALAAYLWEKHR